MELRVGYKETDVGVIPDDWDVRDLGEVFEISAGGDFDPAVSSEVQDAVFPYPIYSNALTEAGLYGYTSTPAHRAGAVTVTARGMIGSANCRRTPFTAIGRVIVMHPKAECDGHYFSTFINQRIDFAVESTGVPQLTAPQISKYRTAVPPFLEQRAIAVALSDADALIDSLDALIAKKRDIKRAAMQQLLTGTTRLPGFTGEWEVKRLGELGATYGGLVGKSKVDFGHGTARYIPFMNVMANVVIDPNDLELVDVNANENQNRAQSGDLFFNGSSETPEEVGMCALLRSELDDLYLNSFCFGFRLKDQKASSGLYLAYFFRSQRGRELLAALAQGATRYNLSKRALMAVKFRCPILTEQLAIAEVLSDVDAELAALEARRDKARLVKQGMMQELLPGRIRLV